MKTKEFSALVKGANQELNGTFKSPFVICNLLNKAAKGDFSKVANCEGLSRENLAKVAKVEIAATEKAAKESEKAAKKAAKEYENAKKCVIKDYNNGMFGEDVLAEKLANLRTKYGK